MPASEARSKACPCALCNGILQPYPTWRRHNRTSDSSTTHVANEIFKMTLKGDISSFPGERRENATPLEALPAPNAGFSSRPAAPDPGCTELPRRSSGSCAMGASSVVSGAFEALSLLDDQIHARELQLNDLWSGLHRSTEVHRSLAVREEKAWFCAVKDAAQGVRTHGDSATAQLKAAMLSRIQGILDDIEVRPNSFPEQNLGTLQEILVDTTDHFNHPLAAANPIIVIAMFAVIVLNLFGHVAHESCNFVLRMLQILIAATLRNPSEFETKLLQELPKDIETVKQVFSLESKTTIYAVCPKCSSTYAPEIIANTPHYQAVCSSLRFSKSCEANLLKAVTKNGASTRIPIRPFSYQSFVEFETRLLSRPIIEQAIERYQAISRDDTVRDMADSQMPLESRAGASSDALSATGRELILLWSLNVDWFNPYKNKQAGKVYSTGAMSMVCLDLPPSLRYQAENMYLAGILPGPREPSLDEINHFLRPLVDELMDSWTYRHRLTRTALFSQGRIVQSQVSRLVCDLPASRKVSGHAGHSANQFCALCLLTRAEITEVDPGKWKRQTRELYMGAALAWRNSDTKKKQDALYKSNGIRWSELLRLPYWDPTRFVVVDPMHNLFLNLIQHHCRILLGIDSVERRAASPPTRKMLEKARMSLTSGTKSSLSRHGQATLLQLCLDRNIRLPAPVGKIKKASLVSLLLMDASTPHNSPLPDVYPLDPELMEIGMVAPSDSHTAPRETKVVISDLPMDIDLGTSISAAVVAPLLTKSEVAQIQGNILNTIRPSWQASLPKNFGDSSHGKLKADQWRTCIEFDLPISMAQIWSRQGSVDSEALQLELLDNTMHLASAIFWGTSRRTSLSHAEKYMGHMTAYIKGVLKLFPQHNLRPHHHNALHLGELLLEFGPVHGWWTFPFERLVGKLQRVNTNSKPGELELTIMDSFCAAANLRGLLQLSSCPEALSQCLPIMETAYSGEGNRNALAADIRGLDQSIRNLKPAVNCRPQQASKLDTDVYQAFLSCTKKLFAARPSELVVQHSSCSIRGFRYSTHRVSLKDSQIFFKPSADGSKSSGMPGTIREIFTVANTDSIPEDAVFLAVHCYSPAPTNMANPLDRYPDVRASFWHKDLGNNVKVVVGSQIICHVASHPWCEDTIVIRALDRVILPKQLPVEAAA